MGYVLVVEPGLEGYSVLRSMAFDVRDTKEWNDESGQEKVHICGSPFAFTVDLMLGKGDVFVIKVYAYFCGYLAQIFICRPLCGWKLNQYAGAKTVCRKYAPTASPQYTTHRNRGWPVLIL